MLPEERYQRLLRGHIAGVHEHIAALASEAAPLAQAWSNTLRLAAAAAEPGRVDVGSAPTRDPERPSPDEARVLLLAHLQRARRAFVNFDPSAAVHWLVAGRQLSGAESSPALALEARLASLERGDRPSVDPATFEALRGQATAEGDARTVIGLSVAQALSAEFEGDFESALRAARRASRMARTEAMPQQEYLANVTLARCRRLAGHPHLGARILGSLRNIASAQWRPWLAWELLFSGAIEAARELTKETSNANSAAVATAHALELLESSKRGDTQRFTSNAEALRASTAGSRRLALDASALIGSLDEGAPLGPREGALHQWAIGDDASPPRGLHGVAAAMAGPAQMKGALAFVAADSSGGRRVLMPGSSLLAKTFVPLGQSQRQQGRMDTMVAALALAGPSGLETTDVFRRVYGFEFDPDIHKGALRKLLSRVDEWLGERGSVRTEETLHWLELHAPILVADPRCAPPVDVRVLGMLATTGTSSARDAARSLRIPLRTAQAALQSLLEDGACVRVRTGNLVAYQIEDTTFSEPTRH